MAYNRALPTLHDLFPLHSEDRILKNCELFLQSSSPLREENAGSDEIEELLLQWTERSGLRHER